MEGCEIFFLISGFTGVPELMVFWCVIYVWRRLKCHTLFQHHSNGHSIHLGTGMCVCACVCVCVCPVSEWVESLGIKMVVNI